MGVFGCQLPKQGAAGLLFLRMYAGLAASALESGRARFPIAPKAHYCHHSFLDLYNMSSRFPWVVSPITFSVQIDEDFIGKVSRSSRRVGSQKQMLRTIGRCKAGSPWVSQHPTQPPGIQEVASTQPPGIQEVACLYHSEHQAIDTIQLPRIHDKCQFFTILVRMFFSMAAGFFWPQQAAAFFVLRHF